MCKTRLELDVPPFRHVLGENYWRVDQAPIANSAGLAVYFVQAALAPAVMHPARLSRVLINLAKVSRFLIFLRALFTVFTRAHKRLNLHSDSLKSHKCYI